VRAQVEVGAAWPLTDGASEVRLEDQGYDPGHIATGGRAAIAVRPLSCLELGVAARRVTIDEGRARDGAVLRSRGDVASVLFGVRFRLRDHLEYAVVFEIGAADTVQTLRGARVDGRSMGFAGRTELVIGRGATALVLAFDMSPFFLWQSPETKLPPRLWGLGLYAGLAHRF
jgi:hypothetical protein